MSFGLTVKNDKRIIETQRTTFYFQLRGLDMHSASVLKSSNLLFCSPYWLFYRLVLQILKASISTNMFKIHTEESCVPKRKKINWIILGRIKKTNKCKVSWKGTFLSSKNSLCLASFQFLVYKEVLLLFFLKSAKLIQLLLYIDQQSNKPIQWPLKGTHNRSEESCNIIVH